MEVYKKETDEIIRRFVSGRISHAKCIVALDAAVSGVIQHLKPEELAELRALILANSEIVAKEVKRRQTPIQPQVVN